MSSIGIGILKSVISQNLPFSEIVESGVDETFFEGAELDAYNFVKNFKYNHDKYPNFDTIEAEAPTISFKNLPEEPVQYWADELKSRKKFWLLSKINGEITEYLRKNKINDAISAFKKTNDALLRINQEFQVEELAEIQEKVLDRHDEVQRTPGISGISYGFPVLDGITQGMTGGDFNVIIGQTGSCKSYFCINAAKAAHNQGKNVMMISPEMPPQQIARRVLAMQMQVPDGSIRKGRLSFFAVEKARHLIKEPISIEGETVTNWFKILPSGLYSDVNQVISVAAEYKPDILVVDGFYLLKNGSIRSNSSWKEDESVIFLLKNFAIHTNIPILASTQYNRASPGKLEGARGSMSVEQVASNFYSLEFESPADRENQRPLQTRLLKIKKSRDGDSAVLRYEFDFNKTKITEIGTISGGITDEPEYQDDEYIVDM
jgi:replicative DNA helicase